MAIAFPPIDPQDLESYRNSLALAQPTPGVAPSGTGPRHDITVSQFGDPLLTSAEAMAACGPAAAVAFARQQGRNPTLREAVDVAKQFGWTPERGMAGPGSEQQALAAMGINTKLEQGVDWSKVASDVGGGNPVIIDSPGHYYVASDFDPSTGKFYVGESGKAYAKGAEWLSPDEMASLSGGPRAALYIDHPNGPDPSVATTDPLRQYAADAATRAGIDPGIFSRQIQQESGFNPGAYNPSGATGIAQIMPQYHPGVDPSDPHASLDYAAQLMRQNLDRYNGDYPTALAAYNAGPGAVAQYGGVPPFPETQRYVSAIMGGSGNPSPTPSSAPSPTRPGLTSPGGLLPDITTAPPALRPLIARAQAFLDQNGGAMPSAPAPAPAPSSTFPRTAPSAVSPAVPPSGAAPAEDPGIAAINAQLRARFAPAASAPAAAVAPSPTPNMIGDQGAATPVPEGGTMTAGAGSPFPSATPPAVAAPEPVPSPAPYNGPAAGIPVLGSLAEGVGNLASEIGTTARNVQESAVGQSAPAQAAAGAVADVATGKTVAAALNPHGYNPFEPMQSSEHLGANQQQWWHDNLEVPAATAMVGALRAAGRDPTPDDYARLQHALGQLNPASVAQWAVGGGGMTLDQAAAGIGLSAAGGLVGGGLVQTAGGDQGAQALGESAGSFLGPTAAMLPGAVAAVRAPGLARDAAALAENPHGMPTNVGDIMAAQNAQEAADAAIASTYNRNPEAYPNWAPGASGDRTEFVPTQRLPSGGAPEPPATGLPAGEIPAQLRSGGPAPLALPSPYSHAVGEGETLMAGAAPRSDGPIVTPSPADRLALPAAGETSVTQLSNNVGSMERSALNARQPAGVTPALATHIAGSAVGAAASQLGTDENTTPQERALRVTAGAAAGFLGVAAVERLVSHPQMLRDLPPSPNPGSPGAAALDRIGQQTARQGPTIPLKEWPQRAQQFLAGMLTDERAPLAGLQRQVERVYRNVNGGADLPPSLRAYELDRLTGGVDGAARIRVEGPLQGAYDTAGQDVVGLTKYLEVLDNIDKAESIGQKVTAASTASAGTAQARGAAAAANRQFSGGVNVAESRAALADLEARLGAQRFGNVERAAHQVYDYVDELRQRLVDSGVWSQPFAAELKTKYPHYIPTNILDYMNDSGFAARGQRISLSDNGLKQLSVKGTDKERENVTASLVRLAFEVERRAARNEVARAVYSWRDVDPALASVMREVPSTYHATNREVLVHAFMDGELQNFAVDKALEPVISRTLSGGGGKAETLLNLARIPAQVVRATAVSRNPAFALVRNTVRDVPTYLFSQTAANGVTALPRVVAALAHSYRDVFQGIASNRIEGPGLQRLMAGGGTMGSAGYSGSVQDVTRLARQVEAGGGYVVRSPKDMARFLWDLTPTVGERIENAPRVAAMSLAEQRGATSQATMMAGREATQDFTVGGSLTKTLNQVFPFFNIASQSVPWLYRTWRANPRAATMALLGGIVAPTVAAEAWNRGDPEREAAYNDVPDYVKNLGLVVMSPQPYGGPDERGNRRLNYVVIPLAEFGSIFIPTREVTRQAMGRDAKPTDWARLGADILGSSSPLQTDSPSSALGTFVPTIYGTALQLNQNKDFFRDRAIVTKAADERASRPAQLIAQALQQIPADAPGIGELSGVRASGLEWAVRDVGNGLAGMALGAGDTAIRAAEGKPITPLNPSVNQLPVVGGLVSGNLRSQGGQVANDTQNLYDHTTGQFQRLALGALRNNPSYQTLNGVEQQAMEQRVTSRVNEYATMAIYGSKEHPQTTLDRAQKSAAFDALTPGQKAQTLANWRAELAQGEKGSDARLAEAKTAVQDYARALAAAR